MHERFVGKIYRSVLFKIIHSSPCLRTRLHIDASTKGAISAVSLLIMHISWTYGFEDIFRTGLEINYLDAVLGNDCWQQ